MDTSWGARSQITLVSEADDPKADDKLKNLARIVASRL